MTVLRPAIGKNILTGRGEIIGSGSDVYVGYKRIYFRFMAAVPYGTVYIIFPADSALGVRKYVVKPKEKIMVASYGETSGFSPVCGGELENVNGGKGSTSQVSWGNPVNTMVMQQIENTYYKANNVVGTAAINGSRTLTNAGITLGIGIAASFLGIWGIGVTLLTNTGGSYGSLY
jgi:hypothetical protein